MKILGNTNVDIGQHCEIADDVEIETPEGFVLGDCSVIGPGCKIRCVRFDAGDYTFFEKNVEVGQGGCLGSPDSTIYLGDGVFCGNGVLLNPSSHIDVGHKTGIGAHTQIWTHGAWHIQFGYKFDGVTIGKRCWIMGCSNILPGVKIGNDSAVAMMSLVNKDVPNAVLVGGVPARLIHEYSLQTDWDIVGPELVRKYKEIAKWKKLRCNILYSDNRIRLNGYEFNLKMEDVKPNDLTEKEEDFRDFLRRYGIKIFTGEPFRSIHK